jgi:hypothetical protein
MNAHLCCEEQITSGSLNIQYIGEFQDWGSIGSWRMGPINLCDGGKIPQLSDHFQL